MGDELGADPKGCGYVKSYLDRFLDEGARSAMDLGRIGGHVGSCPSCYANLRHFFHTVELPESSYLRETIDELALALYNLAKAIIRDLPPTGPDDVTDNVIITEEGGGSVDENVQIGCEMIDDAEDYAGSSFVGEMDLEELRATLEDAEGSRVMRIDLALGIFARVTPLASRYLYEAWNWIGVLHSQKNELDQAEIAFTKVLRAPDGARNVRSWAHCNLSYIYKHRGDLDRAIKSARRSVVWAEEDEKDPYFGQVAGIYFHLLRGQEGDQAAAEEILQAVLKAPEAALRLKEHLRLASLAPMRKVLEASPLRERYPELFA